MFRKAKKYKLELHLSVNMDELLTENDKQQFVNNLVLRATTPLKEIPPTICWWVYFGEENT